MSVDEHMFVYTYIYVCVCVCVNQIKTANNTVGDLVLFFIGKSSDAVEWSCSFFNSPNKMTNAAYENAMRRCPRN